MLFLSWLVLSTAFRDSVESVSARIQTRCFQKCLKPGTVTSEVTQIFGFRDVC